MTSNSAKDNISSKVLFAFNIIREAYCLYRAFYIELGQLILRLLTNADKICLNCQLVVRISCAKIALASRFVSAARGAACGWETNERNWPLSCMQIAPGISDQCRSNPKVRNVDFSRRIIQLRQLACVERWYSFYRNTERPKSRYLFAFNCMIGQKRICRNTRKSVQN